MNPTPLGEGKTTVSIGLADGMRKLSLKCLSRPAGALSRSRLRHKGRRVRGRICAGHPPWRTSTCTSRATSTPSLPPTTCSPPLIDNHIKFGNALGIKEVIWRRCLDLNDRALRVVQVGLGGAVNGVPREDGFVITAASEIMAVLCLASSLSDLKRAPWQHRHRIW